MVDEVAMFARDGVIERGNTLVVAGQRIKALEDKIKEVTAERDACRSRVWTVGLRAVGCVVPTSHLYGRAAGERT